jgi:hypothetical protein
MSSNSSPDQADAEVVKWLGDAWLRQLEHSGLAFFPAPRIEPKARELSPRAKLYLWCAAVDLLVRNSTYQDKDHALS